MASLSLRAKISLSLASEKLGVLGEKLQVLGSVGSSELLQLPLDVVRDGNKEVTDHY